MRYAFSIFILALLLQSPAHAFIPEDEAIKQFQGKVQEALIRSDYQSLETLSAELRQNRSRMPSGQWKIRYFYSAADQFVQDKVLGSQADALFSRLDEWSTRYPQSPTPHILRTKAYIKRAWQARGNGFGNTVSKEAAKKFYADIALAKANFEKHRALITVDPAGYEDMFDVAKAESWSSEQVSALLKEAVAKEPSYYINYYHAMMARLPKWGGSMGEVDEIARYAEKLVPNEGMYARTYINLNDAFQQSSKQPVNIFRHTKLSWKALKPSLDALVMHYPTLWNYVNYAHFACLAQDDEAAPKYLKMIAQFPEVTVADMDADWGASLYTECKNNYEIKAQPDAIMQRLTEPPVDELQRRTQEMFRASEEQQRKLRMPNDE